MSKWLIIGIGIVGAGLAVWMVLASGEPTRRLESSDGVIRGNHVLSDTESKDGVAARLRRAATHRQNGRLMAAEDELKRVLEVDPNNLNAHARLVSLFLLVGREWDARPHLLSLLQSGTISFRELRALAVPDSIWATEDELMSLINRRRASPSATRDPLPALGLAALAQKEGRTNEARMLLETIVKDHPELVAAQTRLGTIVANEFDPARFLAWQKAAPSGIRKYPRYWLACGIVSAKRGNAPSAARCYWEALRRDPINRAACANLAVVLKDLGRSEDGAVLSRRAELLRQIVGIVRQFEDATPQRAPLQQLVSLLEGMGRFPETHAWIRIAREKVTLEPRETSGEPPSTNFALVAAALAPAKLVDCRMYALPEWAKDIPIGSSAQIAEKSAIRFEIANAGIDFQYFNSADPATPGMRMFEFTGGGVGVIDYDADGRPDLYFPQGRRWSAGNGQREHLDQIYRHVGDRYLDATENANLVEARFSQGVACGDIDNDGFSDIYVANIGPNRLFRNNGDGTFSPMTLPAWKISPSDYPEWTVSAAMADLNGDGLADLFDVNYVEGEKTFEQICLHGDVRRVCNPTVFHAQPDRLLLNRGDGTFEDVTEIAGITAPQGTGLGIVAADFSGSGKLSLFIANDAQDNHFYGNLSDPGGLPRFGEIGQINGTAFDFAGHAQACMGVAAGDANADGRLDLFVTNYVDEPNTLYQQAAPGLFVDASRSSGLAKPSYDRLGFGTQFLDADLDGWEGLVVANGHVDDFTHLGYDFLMPAQFYWNAGGDFHELSSETVGPFFAEPRLGRGLARLDWNGDGREEFVVSHLQAPAALLTNVTPTDNHSLRLRFVATNSAREAIGTTVLIKNGDQTLMRQLTAGDGYEASNQRQLVIGTGERETVDSLLVHWPSGNTAEYGPLATDAFWLLVEGVSRPLRLAR